jgi:uncharacterized protein with FMN-binding domain
VRRAPIVIGATVLGTAGVLLLEPLTTTSVVSASPSDTPAASASSATAVPSATPSASASASASRAKDATSTGAAETTRFGTTQVKVTLTNGRITGIAVVEENRNDPRSTQISEGAFPTLRSEVLSKQTAAVDTVSGATWTSVAYEASLQAALDSAGFTAADGSKATTDVSTPQDSGGR